MDTGDLAVIDKHMIALCAKGENANGVAGGKQVSEKIVSGSTRTLAKHDYVGEIPFHQFEKLCEVVRSCVNQEPAICAF